DVRVLAAGGVEDRGEHPAWPAPGSPPVNKRDPRLGDGVGERVLGQCDRAHGDSSLLILLDTPARINLVSLGGIPRPPGGSPALPALRAADRARTRALTRPRGGDRLPGQPHSRRGPLAALPRPRGADGDLRVRHVAAGG